MGYGRSYRSVVLSHGFEQRMSEEDEKDMDYVDLVHTLGEQSANAGTMSLWQQLTQLASISDDRAYQEIAVRGLVGEALVLLSALRQFFPDQEIAVTYVPDPDATRGQIACEVSYQGDANEALAALDEFDEGWLLEVHETFRLGFVVDVVPSAV